MAILQIRFLHKSCSTHLHENEVMCFKNHPQFWLHLNKIAFCDCDVCCFTNLYYTNERFCVVILFRQSRQDEVAHLPQMIYFAIHWNKNFVYIFIKWQNQKTLSLFIIICSNFTNLSLMPLCKWQEEMHSNIIKWREHSYGSSF